MAFLSKLRGQKKQKVSLESLRKLNIAAAALHFLQGVLVLVLSDPDKGLQAVTTSFLAVDTQASETAGSAVLTQASALLFDINLAYLVAAFFFMSAIAHTLVATKLRGQYEKDLKLGVNRFRWFEYAFSAGTMIVAIALLSGIFDFGTLMALFGLIAVMNLMGLSMELVNKSSKKISWLSYYIGCVAGLVPWLVIAVSLASGTINSPGGVPGFVYAIFVSLFLFFNLFAVNMWLQYRKVGRWADYLYGERVYIILSLVAKSALAWQVFAGVLRP